MIRIDRQTDRQTDGRLVRQSVRLSAVCLSVGTILNKMVNGFRYYRALESVSIASALSTALTIYPCQIRVHQR